MREAWPPAPVAILLSVPHWAAIGDPVTTTQQPAYRLLLQPPRYEARIGEESPVPPERGGRQRRYRRPQGRCYG